MDNAIETPNAAVIFRGLDGNECEAFVVAIRDLAFAKGKDEDPNWMLRYATTRLRGKALRWHAELEPSIRKDWDLFVQALFKAYPFVEERCEGEIATPVWSSTTFSPAHSITTLPGNDHPQATAQPAGTEPATPRTAQSPRELGEPALPTRVCDPYLPGCQVGRLLVVYEGGPWGPHYVSASQSVTSNVHQALIVTFIPSLGVHQIARLDRVGEGPKLSVALLSPQYSDGFHRLASGPGARDSTSIYLDRTGYFSKIWSISADGTLSATLPDLVQEPGNRNYYIPSENYYSTATAYVDISGQSISFVKDSDRPRTTHPSSELPIVRARIVFEPTR